MKTNAPDHPKMKLLAKRLDVWHVTAVGIMACFWDAVAKYHPDGNLTAAEPIAIAEYCKLDVVAGIDPQALVDALIDVRFLDRTADMLLVHNWAWHHRRRKTG